MADRALSFIVRRARETRNLTQGALAAKLGVTQPAVASFESGHHPMHEETFERVAAALGLSSFDLLEEGVKEFRRQK